ncbi:DUF4231 domain-containing protein [Luteolibacter ambystomatis]|uniref:DUF4231 domain-containing protein n=1 Tax=Luteolibacter ambystomatis TaxID=2824561 RepID=A0A975IYW7_9BACT|nr:SLATT domain-containing protein [Luteolibacter ambystomatis]QUE50564.1 DUF4231 domain-containing protein [Luteolibacter ambystomatis]
MSDTPSFIRRLWFVGFAGHRAVPDPAGAKAAIARELEVVRSSIDGELVGISSAAAGADLLFLEACGEAGIRTVVLLPFPRERFHEDFDDEAEWQRACKLMDAAWWCEVSPGGEEAPAAYHVVARESLDIAERMLFLWDGKAPRGLGGTGETVIETRERRIPARLISADTLEARWDVEPPAAKADPAFAGLPAITEVSEWFEKLDERASSSAPRSRRFSAWSMSLNHLATIFQAIFVVAALAAPVGALVKFILVLIAAILPWVGGRLRWKERWIRDRVGAELLRSLLASHQPGSPLRPPAIELFGREEALLRTAAMHLIRHRGDWEAARDHYLRERVDGQIGYLKSKGEKAAAKMKIFGTLFWVSALLSMVLGGVAVAGAFMGTKPTSPAGIWLIFLTTVLPGVAAWCLAMISVFEFKRRASLYRQLVEELIRLRPQVAAANCASALTRAMQQIERLLLNELWEWQGSLEK